MLRRFANDVSGSVGMALALGSITLLGAISASLDYSRMSTTRAALGGAADAAALAAALATPAEQAALARSVFDANFRDAAPVSSFITSSFRRGNDEVFRVEAVATVAMTLSQAIGFTSVPVSAVSEVVLGNDADIQAALVLDVTGSMGGTKLTNLKTSATNMVNTLFTRLQRTDQVKMSVVPFAEYVNIGLNNRNANWTTNTADHSVTTQSCNWKYRNGSWRWDCEDEITNYVWKGCVGSRSNPNNIKDDNYNSERVPGVFNVNCPIAMLPLSTNKQTIIDKINALSTGGNTYIPAGAMWGWATLSAIEPFTSTTVPDRTTKRYLVLMTDGANTISPTYPYHDGGNTTTANNLTRDICTNIKNDDIEVFSIAFQVNNGAVKTLLQNCATSTDKYFDASNSNELSDAFDKIARQMTNLRIAK